MTSLIVESAKQVYREKSKRSKRDTIWCNKWRSEIPHMLYLYSNVIPHFSSQGAQLRKMVKWVEFGPSHFLRVL